MGWSICPTNGDGFYISMDHYLSSEYILDIII